jgi:hypothetical protein
MHVKKIHPAAPPVLPATLAAALTVGLAACGTSPSSSAAGNGSAGTRATSSASATADPLADLSAAAILAKAFADTTAASSVHITGTGTDSGHKVSIALTVVRGKGCTGTISLAKSGSLQVVVLGKSVWIKPDDRFLKFFTGSNASLVLSQLSGKWLKDSASDTSGPGSLVSACTVTSLLGHATLATDQWVKGTRTTLNGQPVLLISDVTEQGTFYVTDTANPELLRITTTGTDVTTTGYSGYGTPATITPPPASEVVDGSKYGL